MHQPNLWKLKRLWLIDWFYPCRSIGGTVNSELKILQKRSKTHFSGKRTKIYINFNFFCFGLKQRKSEEGDFRFGPREKWNESENMKEGEGEGRVRVNATQAAYQIGTLRSEVGDGRKTVAEKVNSRSFNLHRDYSKSLTLSNVGEPS